MPTVFTHAVFALALAPAFWRPGTPKRLWVLGAACAAAPDLDVATFRFGISYDHVLGHRGLTHSLAFAAVFAALVAFAAFPRANPLLSRWRAWLYLFLATASHGVLDMLTNGGLGVGLLIPFDNARRFFPFRPVQVSPISPPFFTDRGIAVVRSELVWIWLPAVLLALGVLALRRRAATTDEHR